MDRFQYDTEDRDALIADITGKLVAMRRAQLALLDAQVLRETSDAVLDYLACSDDAQKLVLGLITYAQVLDKVLDAECEIEAIKEVEAMEGRRAESRGENRIAMFEADRVAA